MNLVGVKKLGEFGKKNQRAVKPLTHWRKVVESADWKKFADVRRTFGTADPVGKCWVFNIGGNNYRLIAKIQFEDLRVTVLDVLTHSEYDKNKWKTRCGCI